MQGQDRTILKFTRTPIVFVRRRLIAIERIRPRSLAFGGADRDRTDDLKLAKLALSQLSYGPWDKTSKRSALKWWARDELNVRPHAYQACALTT